MALPITPIPVLTGEVAAAFETEAEKNMDAHLRFVREHPDKAAAAQRRIDEYIKRVMANAELG